MSLKIAGLNARGLRDRSKAVRLLRDLLSFSVDVAAIQEKHFTCVVDARVLSIEYVNHA